MSTTSDAPEPKPASSRLQSLDILRAVIILVMMFVNDLAGVTGTPGWMKHIEPSDSDGMTFVDIVFPAFLFLVGVSIPFALGNRLERGTPLRQIWQHILVRAAGLLVIGVFMVNNETIAQKGPLSPTFWGLILFTGVILTWIVFPVKEKSKLPLVLRVIGIGFLVAAALLYRGNDATGWMQLRPQWWGILGLIGWAYLVACAVYASCRKNLAGVVAAIALLYCVAIADAVGGLSFLGKIPIIGWLTQFVSVGTQLGALGAVSVSGMALGMMLAPGSPLTTHTARIRWAFFYGLALWVAGYLLHTAHDLNGVFIYNKNNATPPWCLISSAVTTWLWIPIYLLSDVRPMRLITSLTQPGQNALLAYILPDLFYIFVELLNKVGIPFPYYDWGNTFAVGFWRSLVFAVFIVWVAGALQKRGVFLKL